MSNSVSSLELSCRRPSATRASCPSAVDKSSDMKSGGLRGLDDLAERRWIADGEVGQDLAVDLNARFGHAANQLGVRKAILAHGGVDADDPQAAEFPLPLLAAVEHVAPGVTNGFERNLPVVVAVAAETLGVLENAIAAAPRFESTFCARHLWTSLFRHFVISSRTGASDESGAPATRARGCRDAACASAWSSSWSECGSCRPCSV